LHYIPKALYLIESKHPATYPQISPTRLLGELSARTILIASGGYGIGATIAMAFIRGVGEGILFVRTGLKLRETAQRIANNTVNTTSQSNIQKLFDALKTAPDILINNAGFLATPPTSLTLISTSIGIPSRQMFSACHNDAVFHLSSPNKLIINHPRCGCQPEYNRCLFGLCQT